MAARKTNVAFKGTAEQERKLQAIIAEHKNQDGALMPVLQKAQDLYGYLPVEVMEMISRALRISLAEVYGVATFYSQFTLNPKGQYKVAVCLGTACYVKGSQNIIDRVKTKLNIEEGGITSDGKFSLDSTRCIGACSLAPIMTINDDVYGSILPEDVDSILEKYV